MKGLYRGFCRNENGTETIVLNGEKINGEWVQGFLATECHIIDDTDSFTYFGKGGMDGFAKLVIPETVCEAEEKVSVVRCKDCMWWHTNGCAFRNDCTDDLPIAEDFCSQATRKRREK